MAKKVHRNYENSWVSVTQLLDVMRKIELEIWFKINTPKFIEEESRRGRTIGTAMHEAIENFIANNKLQVDTEYPDEVLCALKSFALFRKEHPEINLQKSELIMSSEKYKLNGTLDCIARENGKEILLDWKSGKAGDKDSPAIYISYLYQVSAYAMLYEEKEGKTIDYAYVISMAKDKVAYSLKKINRDWMVKNFENIVKPCLQIYYYEKENKKELLSL